MSHLARDPRSGIDSKAIAAGRRHHERDHSTVTAGGGRMSHLARDPRSGIDSKAIATGRRHRRAGRRTKTAEAAA